MKKIIISLILVTMILLSAISTVLADGEIYVDDIPRDSHKIRNKWDSSGTFTSGRDLYTSAVGRTWTYQLHVKEAMYSPYSKGIIKFESGDDVIIAHVEDVKQNYAYWGAVPYAKDNIATVGWAEYNDTVYYFMCIAAEGGIWIILSDYSYATRWAANGVYLGAERAYQVLSFPWWPDGSIFELDPKEIH